MICQLKSLIIFLLFFAVPLCGLHAQKLQILHTNDIHSYFDHIDQNPKAGGYDKLKTLIDTHKAQAKKQGISNLVVDAGDFLEGHLYYMADYGRKSFEMHNRMGYDIAVIGNHDYLMGTRELNGILRDVSPKFSFLGANVSVDSRYSHINQHLKPYRIVNVGGKKIGFLGVTTDEFFYTWRLENGDIRDPLSVAERYADRLKRKEGCDFVVAVTHIGFNSDKRLASEVSDIDLIIGGHSHTELHDPHYERSFYHRVNGRGGFSKTIPIVQTGKHAEFLGKLVLDLSGKKLKIDDYGLIPVKDQNRSRGVASLIKRARGDLNQLYGKKWLDEVVGHSRIHPKNKKGMEIWAQFVADALRESIRADVGIHQPNMVGPNFPIGEIDREDLLNGHPRFFEFEDYKGWKVHQVKVRGYFLRTVFKIAMNFELPLSFSGVDFNWVRLPWGGHMVSDLRIKGEKVNPFELYTLAMPEGIVRGGREVSKFTRWILKRHKATPHLIISAIEDKLRRRGPVGNDYLKNREIEALSSEATKPRTFFPGVPR